MNKKCPLCDEPAVISHELTTTNVVYCGNPACPCNWHGMTEEVWNHRPEEERLQARITELEARIATLRIELDKADGAGQELMAENEALRAELAALKEAARRIPVSEQLPPRNVRVRVWINGTESIARYSWVVPQWETIDGLYYHGDTLGYVTHWQLMPEYREDGEG